MYRLRDKLVTYVMNNKQFRATGIAKAQNASGLLTEPQSIRTTCVEREKGCSGLFYANKGPCKIMVLYRYREQKPLDKKREVQKMGNATIGYEIMDPLEVLIMKEEQAAEERRAAEVLRWQF